MRERYRKFLKSIDASFLRKEAEALWRKEYGQTFRSYRAAAFYVKDLLDRCGIPNAEIHEFPADGKSVSLDARMPLAWEAETGRLTLLNASGECISGPFGRRAAGGGIVAADYEKHPFSLVKGSVLAGGTRTVRILTAERLLGGACAENALVVLKPGDKPDRRFIGHILDLGALGFVSDGVSGAVEYPDSIGWFNAATEDGEWHVTAAHRDFLGFSVTPRIGAFLRREAERTELLALAECDGRRYAGVHHAVTALIPGRRPEEVWAYAHLYEPMIDDDSCGVAAAVETARHILREGVPEYSVRFVFAMEYYGYTAYIARLGGNIRGRVIGGCNFDGIACMKGASLRCFRCPSGTPFFGNLLVDVLNEETADDPEHFAYADKGPSYADDMAYAVPSIGLPSVWNPAEHGADHHTSRQTPDRIDGRTFARAAAYNAALVDAFANPTPELFEKALPCAERRIRKALEEIRENPFGSSLARFRFLCSVQRRDLADFARAVPGLETEERLRSFDAFCAEQERGLSAEDPEAGSKWRTFAARIAMRYADTGFPFSTVRLGRRMELPFGSIYGTVSYALAALHAETTLADAFRRAEYEAGRPLSGHALHKHINALNRLADAGYLRVTRRPEITKDEIVERLKMLGAEEGGVLLVHAAVSECGYVRGGAETVLEALEEAVGKQGTVLFPAFTRPYIYLGEPCREWAFRPYDPADLSQIWTGELPKTVLRTRKDALRSRHVSHSWCGFGPLAEACLMRHEADEPPCCPDSPPGIAMRHGAKILHFGSGLSSTTFLHVIEDACDVPFLGDAVCAERLPDGKTRLHVIRKHLPGHRDFYMAEDAAGSKFFRAAQARGLHIAEQELGTGRLRLMDAGELFRIGCALVKEDFRILLCDSPACGFCSRF